MVTNVDWFQVGRDHWEHNQNRLQEAAARMPWQPLPADMPMMPGLAIKAAIQELRLPKVGRVAESADLAPYGFIGIECHYRNADVQVFLIDEGTHISPLFALVTERA